ncbi:MAG: hypothetical protein AB1642_06555 [Pseudomonadota bacterium]
MTTSRSADPAAAFIARWQGVAAFELATLGRARRLDDQRWVA